MKNLLIFAHHGEAQAFLRSDVRPMPMPFEHCFEGPEYYLLICGEGLFKSLTKTSAFLGMLGERVNTVINFGIMGATDSQHFSDQVISIRTVFASIGKTPLFHSYTSADELAKTDLVTSHKRIFRKEELTPILPMANHFDCEAWGVFSAAGLFQKKVYAYKLTSDVVGDNQQCKSIQDGALVFSKKFKEVYQKIAEEKKTEEETRELPGLFYASNYQLKQWQKLTGPLSTEEFNKLHDPKVFEDLDLERKRPKERMGTFLVHLQTALDPEKAKIEKKINHQLLSLQSGHVRGHYDKTLESSALNLSASLKTKKDIQELIKTLSAFDFQAYEECFLKHEDLHV